jgi:alanine dehydrogenase
LTRFFTESDVLTHLPVGRAIDVLEEAFRLWGRGEATDSPRRRIRLDRGFFHIMTAAIYGQGVHGFKSYSVGGSTLVNLYDSSSGELLALLQAGNLGQIRTGAASGLATRFMARSDSSTVACIGSGFQAETQLAAVCAVRSISSARAYSRSAEKREAFAQKMSDRLGISVEPAESGQACVNGADIINVITSSRDPVLEGDWLEAGQHINAAGSNHWMRRELDDKGIRRSDRIVVDSMATAKVECGELIWAVDRAALNWERVRELREVVVGDTGGRSDAAEITLFESQGLAIEDVAVANYLYRQAGDNMPELPF